MIQTKNCPRFNPFVRNDGLSPPLLLPGTNSSRLCSAEPVSVRASEYACGSVPVRVGCVGRIICLALLSSLVCLRGALCLLGAACPPERLLQHNHFKPEPVPFRHTYAQTPAGIQVAAR